MNDEICTTTFLSDKPINHVSYGVMQLAGPGVFGPPQEPSGARVMLRRTIELGVDHIDTSQDYAPDVVKDLIPEALHPHPANLVWLDFLRAEPSITRIGRGSAHPAC